MHLRLDHSRCSSLLAYYLQVIRRTKRNQKRLDHGACMQKKQETQQRRRQVQSTQHPAHTRTRTHTHVHINTHTSTQFDNSELLQKAALSRPPQHIPVPAASLSSDRLHVHGCQCVLWLVCLVARLVCLVCLLLPAR